MNLFKRATATLALVALLSGVFSTGVSAYSATELEGANYLAKAGIINDHSNNPAGYELDQAVKRQEIAAVARGIAGLEKATTCKESFKDVTATTPNNWACLSVEPLLDNKLIAANEYFRPEDNISKAEAIGMVVKAAFGSEYEYDNTLSTTWEQQVVAFAVAKGVTNNFTNYTTPATRGFVFEAGANASEVVAPETEDDLNDIMCELLGICEEEGEGDDNVAVPPVAVVGELEITLNPKSPTAKSIPLTGLVPFGSFDFTAGKADTSISQITIKREGLANRSDIRRVYFEKNGIRISNRTSIAMDDTAVITFTPAISVKAGSTETLDLVVELDQNGGAQVGAEHKFSILSASDVESTSSVGGRFPVSTNVMRISSYKVNETIVTGIGTSGTTEPTPNLTNVGETNVLFAEFRLQNDGEKDSIFKSVTFRNGGAGDVSSSLSNLALYSEGVKVSKEIAIVGRDVTVYVDDTIPNYRTKSYELRADVIGAETSNEKYQFEIRNTTDLNLIEQESGFSTAIKIDALTTGNEWKVVTIKGGDFLISRDTNYSLNQTVASSTADVVLYAAKINVREDINAETVIVDFDATSSDLKKFSTIKVEIGGLTVGNVTPDGVSKTVEFDSDFTIRAGASTMRVVGNLNSTATNNDKFEVKNVSFRELRYVSNDIELEAAGSAPGIKVLVADGELTLTKNDGIDTSAMLVPGAMDKTVLGFSLRANDVSALRVTGIKGNVVKAGTGITSETSQISNYRLYQDNKLVKTSNTPDFTGLNITIAKNSSSNFVIQADFSNSIVVTGSGSVDRTTYKLEIPDGGIKATNVASGQAIDKIPGISNSSVFTFTDGGTATVTANSSQAISSIVTPGAEKSLFKFDIDAKEDNLMVTDLYVKNTATSASSTGVVNLADAVSSSSLYIDGKTYTGNIIGTGVIHFGLGSNGVVVKKDQLLTGDVRLSFHNSDTRTKQALRLEIPTGTLTGAVNGTLNGMRIVSESTGSEIDRGTTSVVSKDHLLMRSKPTVSMVSGFAQSQTELYKFTVTADSSRRILLDTVTVDLQGSNLLLTGATVTLYRDTRSTQVGTGTLAIGENSIAISSNQVVDAGSTATFILDVSNMSGNTANGQRATREVKLVGLSYTDDITGATTQEARNYNIGLPTAISSYNY